MNDSISQLPALLAAESCFVISDGYVWVLSCRAMRDKSFWGGFPVGFLVFWGSLRKKEGESRVDGLGETKCGARFFV